MVDFNKITKKKFESVYNMYPPNNWIRFAYKYFSEETEKKNIVVRNKIIFPLIILFFLGFLGTIFNMSSVLIGVFTISYTFFLILLVLYLFGVVFFNNIRIKKISKELGITKQQYSELIEKLYE